jgi:nitrate/TMAO reductase-like tetraheme cytochrome c subunit
MIVPKRMIVVMLSLSFVLVAWSVIGAGAVLAQEADNEACLACHGQPGLQTTLPSGEILYLTVDPDVFEASVHGLEGFLCVHCHADLDGYPHPPLAVETRRELSLSLYRSSCILCHQDKYDATLDSVHAVALAGGDDRAAICTDCHGTHNIGPATEPRSRGSQMCELCHSEIFELYKQSVHGAALIGEGNPDVPSCIDCHQVHRIEGPLNSSFHLFSPQICANCHADAELMAKYGISTDVFDTYVADFHGTTVVLFEKLAPDQETNKPVCIDCHGVHDMKQVDDPESAVMKENLLATCQKCHPDATTDFPTSWIGHYPPDPDHAPLVFFVRLFYLIFIPAVLGIMVVFVATDVRKRLVDRSKEQQHGQVS